MTTCRVCKGSDDSLFVKYAVRHYAHPKCYLDRFGFEGLAKLTDWQIGQLPWLECERRFTPDQLEHLKARIKADQAQTAAYLARHPRIGT